MATADTSELSSLPLSELSVDESGPPTVLQGLYMPLSTSTPICMQQDNQPMTDSALDESPFQQVIPGIPQQSLYPSLAALGTSINTAVIPPIPFSRRVINDIQEKQRKALKNTVEGTVGSTNTSPTLEVEEHAEEAIVPGITSQARMIQADTQEETLQPESSETENTSVKKVDIPRHRNTGPTEVQNTSETDD